MKKVIVLVITLILIALLVMPVMASEDDERQERTVFQTDVITTREGDYLSVYDGNIWEFKNGEWSKCTCKGLCYCTQLHHVLEETTEYNFYSTFLKDKYDDYAVYSDCSTSMIETFCYEKSQIMSNLSEFLKEKEIKDVFKKQKTDLYGLLKSFDLKDVGNYTCIMPEKTPIIITDLWDTKGEDMDKYIFAGEIIFCVPYASTNKEAVLHCEEVVNDILNHSFCPSSTAIYLVYTDEVIARYCDGYLNGQERFITIYVP